MRLLVLLLCLVFSPILSAQEAPAAPKESAPKEEKKEGISKAGESKKEKPQGGVIDLGKIKVTGQVRKPEAFYILQRSTLNLPESNKKKSFLGNVVESVEKNSEF
jgi:hypothetical protein